MARRSSALGGTLAAHRALLLDAIRGAGQASRASLARSTGLNAATVTVVIRELLNDGLIVETGRAASTGGKRAVLLALADQARFAIGVHLDHTSITYVLVNLSGDVVGCWPRRGGADAREPQLVIERIAEEVRMLVRLVGVDPRRLVGIGLVSPGPATSATAIGLSSAAMRPWIDFPLVEAVAATTGLPVVYGNDATAAAIGEFWSGAVGSDAVYAAVYMGTGIGAGIVASGSPIIGSSGNAGEVGHMCVELGGRPCWCGSDGCLETVAGAAAIVDAARKAGLTVGAEFLDEQFAEVARTAKDGHPDAVAIFEKAATYVAVGVQALTNILDLDHVILTGPGFAAAGSLFAPAIRRRLEETFFARGTHAVDVSVSRNADVAAAMGAAAMALQVELAPRTSVSGGRLPPISLPGSRASNGSGPSWSHAPTPVSAADD